MTFQLVQQFVPDLENYRHRDVNNLTHIVIHRSGPWPANYGDPQDAAELTNIYYNNNLGTGGKMPYTFVVHPERRIVYQSNYISAITPHARSHNKTGVGVAILQDLRAEMLSEDAYVTLVKMCAYLRQRIGTELIVAGHTDLKDATTDPYKQCPGKMLDCDRLDQDVILAHRLIYTI